MKPSSPTDGLASRLLGSGREWIKAILESPKRVLGLSLPARAALILAVILASVAAAVFYLRLDRASQGLFLRDGFLIGALLVAIPAVAYFTVRSWLETDGAKHRDIDRAWQAGLAALQRQGLDFEMLPLYLILGVRDGQEAQLLVAAGEEQGTLLVNAVPALDAPIIWFATREAVYLACIGATETAVGALAAPVQYRHEPALPRETAGADEAGGRAAEVATPIPLDQVASERAKARLQCLCKLARNARPYAAPLNGVLLVMRSKTVLAASTEVSEFAQRLTLDLRSITNAAQLRCPVIALVPDMHGLHGFTDLIARSMPTDLQSQRIGGDRKLLWQAPTTELMALAAGKSCESLVFKIQSVLASNPASNVVAGPLDSPANVGNGTSEQLAEPVDPTPNLSQDWRLYELACRVRTCGVRNLASSMKGFVDAAASPDCDPMLFGGCYFGSLTPSAFVSKVFDRLKQERGNFVWTRAALATANAYRRWRIRLWWLNLLLFVGLVVLCFVRFR